jgi:sec-independent protein translocase protein TatA
MLGSLGWEELLIILVILALLFGASRVAGLGGALGRGIREFRQEASRSDSPEDEKDRTTTQSTTTTTTTTPPSGESTPRNG